VKRRYSKQTIRPDRAAGSDGSRINLDSTLRFLTNFQRFAWDFGGVAVLAFGAMTLLALFDLTGGVVLSWWGTDWRGRAVLVGRFLTAMVRLG